MLHVDIDERVSMSGVSMSLCLCVSVCLCIPGLIVFTVSHSRTPDRQLV